MTITTIDALRRAVTSDFANVLFMFVNNNAVHNPLFDQNGYLYFVDVEFYQGVHKKRELPAVCPLVFPELGHYG